MSKDLARTLLIVALGGAILAVPFLWAKYLLLSVQIWLLHRAFRGCAKDASLRARKRPDETGADEADSA